MMTCIVLEDAIVVCVSRTRIRNKDCANGLHGRNHQCVHNVSRSKDLKAPLMPAGFL